MLERFCSLKLPYSLRQIPESASWVGIYAYMSKPSDLIQSISVERNWRPTEIDCVRYSVIGFDLANDRFHDIRIDELYLIVNGSNHSSYTVVTVFLSVQVHIYQMFMRPDVKLNLWIQCSDRSFNDIDFDLWLITLDINYKLIVF